MKKIFIGLAILVALGVATSVSAASEPESFTNYVDVFFEMVKGTAGQLVMALIMMFAGHKAYENRTVGPLIWGAVAVVLIAAAPTMSTSLTTSVGTFMTP